MSEAPSGSTGWLPAGPARPKRRIAFGCLALVLLLLVGALVVVVTLLPQFGPGFSVLNGSNGQIERFNLFDGPSGTHLTFQAARGIDLPDGPRLACTVVRPRLAGTNLANLQWTIVNRAGDVIASYATPCPGP